VLSLFVQINLLRAKHNNKMNIREIKPSDNQALANMIRSVFKEHDAPTEGTVFTDPTTDALFELFESDNAVLWVATENETVLGCCGIYPTEGLPQNCTELVKFYLPKEARGKGIGRALMEKSIESARKLNYSDIYIESLPEFAKAVKIYKKQGFEQLIQPLGNSGHNGCTLWFLKKLD
jgi:putative acetyltransferase